MRDFITYAEWHVPHLNLALGAMSLSCCNVS